MGEEVLSCRPFDLCNNNPSGRQTSISSNLIVWVLKTQLTCGISLLLLLRPALASWSCEEKCRAKPEVNASLCMRQRLLRRPTSSLYWTWLSPRDYGRLCDPSSSLGGGDGLVSVPRRQAYRSNIDRLPPFLPVAFSDGKWRLRMITFGEHENLNLTNLQVARVIIFPTITLTSRPYFCLLLARA